MLGCRDVAIAVEQTTGRERLNIHGAINLEQILAVEKVNALRFIKLLGEIEGTHTAMRLIHVFVDNASYHAKQQAFIDEYENLLNTMRVDEAHKAMHAIPCLIAHSALNISRARQACENENGALNAESAPTQVNTRVPTDDADQQGGGNCATELPRHQIVRLDDRLRELPGLVDGASLLVCRRIQRPPLRQDAVWRSIAAVIRRSLDPSAVAANWVMIPCGQVARRGASPKLAEGLGLDAAHGSSRMDLG